MNSKNMRYLSISILAVFSLLGCGSESTEEQGVNNKSAVNMELSLTDVSMPFGEDKTPWSEFQINPEKDTVIVLRTGSYVIIPENAFKTAAGELVTEPVDFKIKEYNDPLAFFSSGIPMTISDNENEVEFMSSGGMIDVSASANGEDVLPNPDNLIEVGIATDREGDFPLWSFEENSGWKEDVTPLNLDQSRRDSIQSIKLPEMPRLKNQNYFEISQQLVELRPSLKKFQDASFVPVDPKDNGKIISDYLKDFDLKELGRGRYELTITEHFQDPVTIVCAMAYDKSEYNRKLREYYEEYGKTLRRQKAFNLAEGAMQANGLAYLNAFGLREFTKYNIDRIEKLNSEHDFTIDNLEFGAFILFCVDFTRNSKFKCNYDKKIRVSPQNDFGLMAVGNDNQIYYSSVSKCKSSKSEKGYALKMEELRNDQSLEELQDLLKK